MNRKQILEATRKSINELVLDFQNNKFDYLSESDIKIKLVHLLKEKIDVYIHNADSEKSPIHIVKSEYPYPNTVSAYQKLDIAILHPQSPTPGSNLWQLPIFIAIELKYSIDKRKDKSFLNDIQKINSIKDCSRVALHFSRFPIKDSFDVLNTIEVFKKNNYFVIDDDKVYRLTNIEVIK